MPPKCAKRRQLLEEAQVVLQVVAAGEITRAFIAYQTFETGALPSLLRVRRFTALEETCVGHQSVTPGDCVSSLAADVGEVVHLDCNGVAKLAGWCACADFVQE